MRLSLCKVKLMLSMLSFGGSHMSHYSPLLCIVWACLCSRQRADIMALRGTEGVLYRDRTCAL